ncbi:MAG: dTMP kinase [Tissierellia bacterium]|nr:dTMP kinase [Tissierellia bacterium]
MEGFFIALEGPDGSGKSTIGELIYKHFLETDIDVVYTREPGGTNIGEKIRDIILDNVNTEMSNRAEALLYAASRAQHVDEKIRPAIKERKLVICDRFVFSSLAYQGVGRKLGIDQVKMINDFAINEMKPDLVLFFDIDPIYTLERKKIEFNYDRLENEGDSFHKNVFNGYQDIIKKYPDNVKIIDARKSIEEVLEQCLNTITEVMK